MQRAIAVLAGAYLLSLGLTIAWAEEAHIKIDKPGEVTAAAAESLYQRIAGDARDGYAISRDPVAAAYLDWRRYNTGPYLSATHGNRYVNNYANDVAVTAGYGGRRAVMPPGAVLAKDSFTLTDDGEVFIGALFLMEKLPAGDSPSTADWRYWMILPDGSLLGDSEDDSAADVAFCHDCHKAVARRDFLFFVPKDYRHAATN